MRIKPIQHGIKAYKKRTGQKLTTQFVDELFYKPKNLKELRDKEKPYIRSKQAFFIADQMMSLSPEQRMKILCKVLSPSQLKKMVERMQKFLQSSIE